MFTLPWEYTEHTDEKGVDLESPRPLFSQKKTVAIGEIGLEYHHEGVSHDIQKREFERQVLLANELDLPVIVHNREAHNDYLEILKGQSPKGSSIAFRAALRWKRRF